MGLAGFWAAQAQKQHHKKHYTKETTTISSVTSIAQNFPTIKQVVLAENYGFAKGYNEGLKHIDADLYCLLNNDVEVTENWLNPIIEGFKSLFLIN